MNRQSKILPAFPGAQRQNLLRRVIDGFAAVAMLATFPCLVRAQANPTFQVTPRGLDFGNIALGTTSAAQAVTITNISASTVGLGLNGVVNAGTYPSTTTCSTTLTPGQSCAVHIAFAPAALGASSSSVNLAVGGQNFKIDEIGNGIAPVLVTPVALNFGAIPSGTTSPNQQVTIRNVSGASIHINLSDQVSGTSFAGDYGSCPDGNGILVAGASCIVNYRYSPPAGHYFSDTGTGIVTVNGSATSVALSGFATLSGSSSLLVTPSGLNFGDVSIGANSQQAVTLTNQTGSSYSIEITGGVPNNSAFLGGNGCGGTLAAGASCSFYVTFAPTVLGVQSGSVTFGVTSSDSSADGTFAVALRGSGIDPLRISPTEFDFGATTIGTNSVPQSTMVTNTGSVPVNPSLYVTGVTGASPFGVSYPGACNAMLQPGASCRLVDFIINPSATGVIAKSGASIDSFGVVHALAFTDFGTLLSIPSITTGSPLPAATQSEPYSTAFAATGGTIPYSFKVDPSTLPIGMSLDPASGILSGTPVESGDYVFTIGVTDATGAFSSGAVFELSIAPTQPDGVCGSSDGTLARTAPPPANLCASGQITDFMQNLLVSGSTSGWSWQCTVAGGATASCSANYYNIVHANVVGGHGTIATYRYDSNGNPVVGTPGTSIVAQEDANNSYMQFQIAADPGFIVNQALTGTCDLTNASPQISYTYLALQNDAGDCTLYVSYAPITAVITTPSPLPLGEPGIPYNAAFQASGGTPPYAFVASPNAVSAMFPFFGVPPGLVVAADGSVSGTPTTVGRYYFFVNMNDAAQGWGYEYYELDIDRIFSDGFDGLGSPNSD